MARVENKPSSTEQAKASPAPADSDFAELTRVLGHEFGNPALLREALTHSSALPARGAKTLSYQRLEFLGDRVLGLVVADLLICHFPREPEGALARRLASLVRRETLAEVSSGLDLGRHLVLAKAEADAGGRENPALLADACEAVIGALYVDGGLAAARAFVEPLWAPLLAAEVRPPQDAKTALQEWAQARGLALPAYREVERQGPAHQPVFTIEVAVEGHAPGRGAGRSKRLAEQAAAQALLSVLDKVET